MTEFLIVLIQFFLSGWVALTMLWGLTTVLDYAAGCMINRLEQIENIKRNVKNDD